MERRCVRFCERNTSLVTSGVKFSREIVSLSDVNNLWSTQITLISCLSLTITSSECLLRWHEIFKSIVLDTRYGIMQFS